MDNPKLPFETFYPQASLVKGQQSFIKPSLRPAIRKNQEEMKQLTSSAKKRSTQPRRSQVTLPPLKLSDNSKNNEESLSNLSINEAKQAKWLLVASPAFLGSAEKSFEHSKEVSRERLSEGREVLDLSDLPTPNFQQSSLYAKCASRDHLSLKVPKNKLPERFYEKFSFKKLKSQDKNFGVRDRKTRSNKTLVYNKIRVLDHRFPKDFHLNLSNL
jgi:hypothetical protein